MKPIVSIEQRTRGEVEALVAAGSNLGDRTGSICAGLAILNMSPGCRLTAVSSVYETTPVDAAGGSFHNAVIRIATSLEPTSLLRTLKSIEKALGRTGSRHDARPLDLDILFFGDVAMDTPELTIPHPGWIHRDFVLAPLLEVCEGTFDPRSGVPLAVLAREALGARSPGPVIIGPEAFVSGIDRASR